MQVSTLLRGCMVATLTAVSTLSFAQKVVTTEKTGQLETLIKESERENTPSLKVVGPINGEDIKIIRTMCGRDYSGYESEGTTRTLDLSEALIKQEAGKNYLNEQLGFYNRFYAPSADNEIGIKMFYRCEPLREIILPKTTTVIAGQAFDNCTSLTKCTFCRQRDRGQDVLSLRAASRDRSSPNDDRYRRTSIRPMHLARQMHILSRPDDDPPICVPQHETHKRGTSFDADGDGEQGVRRLQGTDDGDVYEQGCPDFA